MRNRNAMIVYLCSAIVAVVLLFVFRPRLIDEYRFLIIGISSILLLAPLGLLRGEQPEDEMKRLEYKKQSLLVFCIFTLACILLLVVGVVPFTVEVASNILVFAFIASIVACALLAGAMFLSHNRK